MSKGNTNHFKYEKELIRNKYTTETVDIFLCFNYYLNINMLYLEPAYI